MVRAAAGCSGGDGVGWLAWGRDGGSAKLVSLLCSIRFKEYMIDGTAVVKQR